MVQARSLFPRPQGVGRGGGSPLGRGRNTRRGKGGSIRCFFRNWTNELEGVPPLLLGAWSHRPEGNLDWWVWASGIPTWVFRGDEDLAVGSLLLELQKKCYLSGLGALSPVILM